jgi:hypothetical protein
MLSPAALIPSSRPHRQSLIPITGGPVSSVRAITPSSSFGSKS